MTNLVQIRTHVHDYLRHDPTRHHPGARMIQLGLQLLIVLNVLAVILESVAEVRQAISPFVFSWFEGISLFVFAVEYILRLWTAVEVKGYSAPITGRLRFALTPLALVDLAAISPLFLFGTGVDLRILRILRLLRLIKMARYSKSFNILGRVLTKKREALVSALFIFLVIVIVSATLAYYAENDVQPEAFSSIPAAMWWAVITFTTVGYGDIVPLTVVGKLIAIATSVLGIAMFGLVAGILVSGYMEELRKSQKKTPKSD